MADEIERALNSLEVEGGARFGQGLAAYNQW
jgi:hypothetical protein